MYAYDRFWDYASREATKEADMKATIAKLDAAVAERNVTIAKLDAAVAERDAEKARADAAVARADAAEEKLRQDKLQTARNLKAMNLTTEQIAAATDLTVDEIARL